MYVLSVAMVTGGDSKTLMIVQVAPVDKNVGETVASLGFAQRVRAVELGQASRRLDTGGEGSEVGTRRGEVLVYNINGLDVFVLCL